MQKIKSLNLSKTITFIKHLFHPKKHLKFSLPLFVLCFVLIFTFFNKSQEVSSSDLHNLSGYAWSTYNDPVEGGVGWISFNCLDGGPSGNNVCGSYDYGVHINRTTGYIDGYAWSSHYGWLKFGGFNLSDMPTGSGTTQDNARLVGSEIVGWARFCSVYASGCSGALRPANELGGFDGWLSLKGTDYGVTVNTGDGNVSGYAWGGGDSGRNVGWVDFNNVVFDYNVGPKVTLTTPYTTVATNTSIDLNWSGSNLVTDPAGCTATGGVGVAGWAGAKASPSGTFTTPPLANGNYEFSIVCSGGVGGTETSNTSTVNVTVGAPATLSFFASNDGQAPAPGYQLTLTWQANGGNFNNCRAVSSPTTSTWDGAVDSPTPTATKVVDVPVPTKYTLTCTNISAVPAVDVTKELNAVRSSGLKESVKLFSNGVRGINPNYYTTISWETENVKPETCIKSSSTPLASWTGNLTPQEITKKKKIGVKVLVTHPLFTTYTLTCEGLSGDPVSGSLDLNERSTVNAIRKLPIYRER